MDIQDIKNLSDEELVVLSKNGSGQAVNTLLYRYKNKVKAIARGFFLAGGDVDDLIQEGTIALYLSIYSFEQNKGKSFKNFTDMCISRRLLDIVKAAGRQKNEPLNTFIDWELVADDGINCGDSSNPETLFLKNESNMLIAQKIKNTLSDSDYKLFCLYLKGLSYADISATLKISVKKVDNDLQKIKRILKKSIND